MSRYVRPSGDGPEYTDVLKAQVERLTTENAEQLAELHRINEALGTNEGHSSVYWVETIVARGHRLALELECLLLDCKDMAIVSKWMDSGMEAVSEWQESFPYNGPRLGD
jgi:hypothetical protein